MGHITYKLAESDTELNGHFAVRLSVFVEEQNLFDSSDRDERDDQATLIIAIDDGTGAIVGTVRCYELSSLTWRGGRLAVLPAYRGRRSAVATNLIAFAECYVQSKGATRLVALIQSRNVNYFKRLGWTAVGLPEITHGQAHQQMASGFNANNATQRLPGNR